MRRSLRYGLLVSLVLLVLLAPLSPATQQVPSSQPTAPEAQNLTLTNIFHMVGIPGLKRNARGDLILTDRELIFQQGKKRLLVIPYERMPRVQLLSGERHYGKTTAGAVAVSSLGAFLILKKRKVDVLVLDYLNERGGLMGLVLQVPEKQGVTCKDWLVRFGVVVEEPEPLPAKKQN